VGQQPRGDGWFWLGANNPIDELPVFEDEHGGNALNLKLSGRARILVDIQLGDPKTPVRFGSKLFHDWSHHAAGAAPGSPAVEQHRPTVTLKYLLRKGSISYDERLSGVGGSCAFAQVERGATLATLRDLLSGVTRVDAILRSTFVAGYYQHSFLPSESRFLIIVAEKFRETVSLIAKWNKERPLVCGSW
jgi:hypothetical protein